MTIEQPNSFSGEVNKFEIGKKIESIDNPNISLTDIDQTVSSIAPKILKNTIQEQFDHRPLDAEDITMLNRSIKEEDHSPQDPLIKDIELSDEEALALLLMEEEMASEANKDDLIEQMNDIKAQETDNTVFQAIIPELNLAKNDLNQVNEEEELEVNNAKLQHEIVIQKDEISIAKEEIAEKTSDTAEQIIDEVKK